MTARPDSRLRSDLRNCTGDGVTHAFMVGLGETNFPLFALALGKSQGVAGLVATVPQLVGAVLQLCAPWGVSKVGSPRRWIICCATVQFLSFVPMVAAALMGVMPTWVLFAVASIYWAVNLGAAPAWNTWVGALFPRRLRVRYFGRRSRVYQFCIMGALVLGGVILAQRAASSMYGFAAVFALAGLCRLWSVWFLNKQSEAKTLDLRRHRSVDLWEFVGRIRHRMDARALVAMVAMTAAVQVAQPFFIPYMAKQLHMADSAVLAMIAASFAGKSLAAPLWGSMAHKHGARKLFVMGAVGVIPVTLLWMAGDNFWYLLALQAFTGAAFGALELGFFFLSLEAMREEERTSLIAIYLLLNCAATAAGSVLGNMILVWVPAIATGYVAIFAGSAVLRLAAAFLVRSVRFDVAHAEPLATQPLGLQASAGSMELPEPASLEHGEAAGECAGGHALGKQGTSAAALSGDDARR